VANLAISTVCNQNCSYCFTVDHLKRHRGDRATADLPVDRRFLPVRVFEERLDFLTRSNIQEARLLGGEPTLHPQLTDLIDCARASGKVVVVFSNGLMPEKALSCLETLTPEECTVMINVSQPGTTGSNGAFEQQRKTMQRLGKRVLPGFNIYGPDCHLDFLLSLVAETGCKPAIRLGMAHPCLSGQNDHVLPNQYRAIAVKIVHFACAAAEADVTLDFDCGFVRCMFSDADLQTLNDAGANVGWRCNPILDVDIEGNVIHCFPLAQLASLPLSPESEAAALRQAFEEQTRPYRQAGVFKECSACPFKAAGDCPGGCLSTTIRRFRRTTFHLELPQGIVA
jgi:MoaA/NifB/PqqE/SkfB family radical SAM enzyme